jgi:putative Holliday junction resolvase
MRYLGIDFGSKRIGIAVSDEKGEFAIPFIVLKSSKKLLDEVVDIAEENKVEKIILGESKDYKGKPNAIHAESLEFKKKLEGEGYIVEMEPEFMTSIHVEKLQGKSATTDASAAALILQSYLDKMPKQ